MQLFSARARWRADNFAIIRGQEEQVSAELIDNRERHKSREFPMETVSISTLVALRKQRKLTEAWQLVQQLTKHLGNHPTVLAEAAKVLLLNDQPKEAERFYQLVQSQEVDVLEYFEPESLIRLYLAGGSLAIDIERIASTAEWVRHYRNQRIDPLYPVTVQGFEALAEWGGLYDFALECSACHASYSFVLNRTWLVYSEHYCPVCFARQQFDSELIQQAIDPYDQEALEEIERLDQVVLQLYTDINRDAIQGIEFPQLCRYTYIDYLFKYSEFLLEEFHQQLQDEAV